MESASCDVAIIGAGPYGLSVAAHLRAATSLDVKVFGETMSFWQNNMPDGMFLRSPYAGSNIAHPEHRFDLDAFAAARGEQIGKPVPLSDFVAYGQWVQEKVVPDLDRRYVQSIQRVREGFRLGLEDEGTVDAARVVVAAGIAPFGRIPPVFVGIDSRYVSHASAWSSFEKFSGQRVVVIGGGQSALESAALLHESGASVEVLVRRSEVHWLHGGNKWPTPVRQLAHVMTGPSEIGPPGISLLIEAPKAFVAVPRRWQGKMHQRAMRPAGSGWLRPRVDGVIPVAMHTSVRNATVQGDAILLEDDAGKRREVDHVLLGTGYQVDIAGYPFIDDDLLRGIAQVDGYPVLGRGFESSLPGLHFVGAPAAWSYGPLLRFVAGAGYAAGSLTTLIRKSSARRAAA
jgi:hypothetical protein